MKYLLTILSFVAFFVSTSAQEAFYIENYHVDIQLNTNGSFDVTETIDVFFTEERRGIIREIPCRYQFGTITKENETEYAFGANSAGNYEILLDSIHVEDYKFSVSDNGYNKNIRIGSADKFISGAHQYIIKYTVWGAINEFMNHSEFSWNVIGQEWKTEIKQASFNLNFENAIKLKKENIKVFSDTLGGRNSSSIKYLFTNKKISGQTKELLKAGTGITLIVKLPWNYFNKRYRIKRHSSEIFLQKDGSFRMVNMQNLQYNGFQQYNLSRVSGNLEKPIKKKYHLRTSNYALDDTANNLHAWVNGIRGTKDSYKNGSFTKLFRINATNGKTEFKDGEGLLWKWDMKKFYQKVDTLDIKLELLTFAKPTSIMLTKNNKAIDYDLNKNILTATIPKPGQNDVVLLKVTYPKWTYTPPLPSKHLIYDSEPRFVITNFEDDIYINQDATVRIKRKYYVEYRDKLKTGDEIPFSVTIKPYTPDKTSYSSIGHSFEIEQVNPFDAFLSTDYYNNQRLDWGKNKKEETNYDVFEYEYVTYNMLQKLGDSFLAEIPLYEGEYSPVVGGKLRIHCTEKTIADQLTCNLYAGYKKQSKYYITENIVNDTIVELSFLLDSATRRTPDWPILHFSFPKGNIKTSFIKDAKIYANKHDDEIKALLVPIIITLVLLVLWFLLGRDKKVEVVETHYLPDNISPPEVGYIWDGKLQKRDLIALIYHWAGKGYLKISNLNTEDDNISLHKIEELPKSSKNFEKTIFNGLFKNKEQVKVSKLRDSFYSTMMRAEMQFKLYSNRNKLLVPGTRAFGHVLVTLGIIAGTITLLIGLADGELFLIIYALLLAAPFILFGRVMKKFGHLGAKLHAKVLGFKQFIEHSEVDRLMFLLEENPDYFDQTIAYAIVMGKGKTWAKKFDGLLKLSKLDTDGSNLGGKNRLNDDETRKLSTTEYFDRIIKRMHKIEDDFHYKKPRPRSSYSSSSYSSSRSSSYSYKSSSSSSYSSSSSGSSSYGSSGGGYSGSGYGGGGGSSW